MTEQQIIEGLRGRFVTWNKDGELIVVVKQDDAPMPVVVPLGPKCKSIVIAVAASAGLTVEVMCSETRNKKAVKARHVAMWLCREMTGKSFPEIGRAVGNRDHTTVMHGVRKVNANREAYSALIEAARGSLIGWDNHKNISRPVHNAILQNTPYTDSAMVIA